MSRDPGDGASSRWEVREEEGAPSGGLYELEITTRYRVLDRRTGTEVLTFEGMYEASFDTDGNWGPGRISGVVGVRISDDDRFALVESADGTVERVALPAARDEAPD